LLTTAPLCSDSPNASTPGAAPSRFADSMSRTSEERHRIQLPVKPCALAPLAHARDCDLGSEDREAFAPAGLAPACSPARNGSSELSTSEPSGHSLPAPALPDASIALARGGRRDDERVTMRWTRAGPRWQRGILARRLRGISG